MRATELKKYERLLLAQRSKIAGVLVGMKSEALKPNGSSKAADEIADLGSDQFEQELTLGLIETEQGAVKEIDFALDRIEDKTFGKCEGCQDQIPKLRLNALPSARYCVECQSKVEKFGHEIFNEA